MVGPDVEDDELRWLRYAREDLSLASALLEQGHPVPRHACWLSQQAAEKAIKAALVLAFGEAPFLHDLEALLNLLGEDWPDELSGADLEALTPWASDARYPVDRPEPTDENAVHSVAEAQRVYDAISGEFARRGVTGD